MKYRLGNAKSYAIIEVAETKDTLINYIENDNFTFVSYPNEVTGNIEKESNDYISLNYDFSNTTATRAAYLRFKEPIILEENALELAFDVISKETISDYIKLKLIDNQGDSKLIMVQRGFDASNDVKKLIVSLENIELPAKLTDIYVGQDTQDILSKGTIQIGNIHLTSKGEKSIENILPPKDIKGIDTANIESNVSGDNVFKIAIYDSIDKPTILLDKLKNLKLENELNQNSDLIILTSQENEEVDLNITKPILKTSSYNKVSHGNTDIITIDVTNGGIRTTDYMQWTNIQSDIKTSKNKNILILMKGSLENFTDENEKKLFIDVMCEIKRNTNKNIWIITEGNYTTYSMERGIRYLSVNNQNFELTEIAKNTSYILITINGDNLTYEIKNIF